MTRCADWSGPWLSFDRFEETVPFVGNGSAVTVLETEPVRVAVDVTLTSETLRVTIDETGYVVAVDPCPDVR